MDFKKMNKHIQALHMNGLNGRMLKIKSTKKKNREILLVYGHHSSLERMYSLAEVFSEFGNVTCPDLPGFGGMESFYKIGEQPTLDSFADYLAAFIKLNYNRKKVVLVGFSYSVPIIVRMLQKYPELCKNVDFTISIVGFIHKEDFKLKKWQISGLRLMGLVGSNSFVSFILKNTLFRAFFIRLAYRLVAKTHQKMRAEGSMALKERIDFEVTLWTINDLRTWMKTLRDMFAVDLCSARVKVPMHHVAPDVDAYFDNNIVEQHLRIVFSNFKSYVSTMPDHAPSVIASAEEIQPFVPKALRKFLSK